MTTTAPGLIWTLDDGFAHTHPVDSCTEAATFTQVQTGFVHCTKASILEAVDPES